MDNGDKENDSPQVRRSRNLDINELGQTKLHVQVIQNCIDKVENLLECGAEVNAFDSRGYTPLHWAVRRNYDRIATLLIAYGANVNAQMTDASNKYFLGTPLLLAVEYEHKEMINVLLDNGADPNMKTRCGDSAFGTMLKSKRSSNSEYYNEVVKAFMKKGAQFKSEPELFKMVLRHGTLAAVNMFIDNGFNLNSVRPHGAEILHESIFNSDPKVCKMMIKTRKFDVNEVYNNRTLLYNAAIMGKVRVVKCLLKHDVDINAKCGRYNETALFAAVRQFRVEVVRLLLKNKADVNLLDSEGKCILELALSTAHHDVTYEVLRHLALLTEQGVPIHPANFDPIQKNFGVDCIYMSNKMQLAKMKNTVLADKVTMYNVLERKNIDDYVADPELVKEFKKQCVKESFPSYYDLLLEYFNSELELYEMKTAYFKKSLGRRRGCETRQMNEMFDPVFRFGKQRDARF